MKVQITYTECQWRENTIEVEMTPKEYKKYLKLSKREQAHEYGLFSATTDDHHKCTEIISVETEILTK